MKRMWMKNAAVAALTVLIVPQIGKAYSYSGTGGTSGVSEAVASAYDLPTTTNPNNKDVQVTLEKLKELAKKVDLNEKQQKWVDQVLTKMKRSKQFQDYAMKQKEAFDKAQKETAEKTKASLVALASTKGSQAAVPNLSSKQEGCPSSNFEDTTGAKVNQPNRDMQGGIMSLINNGKDAKQAKEEEQKKKYKAFLAYLQGDEKLAKDKEEVKKAGETTPSPITIESLKEQAQKLDNETKKAVALFLFDFDKEQQKAIDDAKESVEKARPTFIALGAKVLDIANVLKAEAKKEEKKMREACNKHKKELPKLYQEAFTAHVQQQQGDESYVRQVWAPSALKELKKVSCESNSSKASSALGSASGIEDAVSQLGAAQTVEEMINATRQATEKLAQGATNAGKAIEKSLVACEKASKKKEEIQEFIANLGGGQNGAPGQQGGPGGSAVARGGRPGTPGASSFARGASPSTGSTHFGSNPSSTGTF